MTQRREGSGVEWWSFVILVGTVAGMGMKFAIGLVMIGWFFVDCFWVG